MEQPATEPCSGVATEISPAVAATSGCPPVYVLLAPVPDPHDPTRYCPRALVLVDHGGRWHAYSVYPDDRRALGSAAAANAIMVPAAQKWLRLRGWRTYEFFVPQRSSAAGTVAPGGPGVPPFGPGVPPR
jgi:hypothetical protein